MKCCDVRAVPTKPIRHNIGRCARWETKLVWCVVLSNFFEVTWFYDNASVISNWEHVVNSRRALSRIVCVSVTGPPVQAAATASVLWDCNRKCQPKGTVNISEPTQRTTTNVKIGMGVWAGNGFNHAFLGFVCPQCEKSTSTNTHVHPCATIVEIMYVTIHVDMFSTCAMYMFFVPSYVCQRSFSYNNSNKICAHVYISYIRASMSPYFRLYLYHLLRVQYVFDTWYFRIDIPCLFMHAGKCGKEIAQQYWLIMGWF